MAKPKAAKIRRFTIRLPIAIATHRADGTDGAFEDATVEFKMLARDEAHVRSILTLALEDAARSALNEQTERERTVPLLPRMFSGDD